MNRPRHRHAAAMLALAAVTLAAGCTQTRTATTAPGATTSTTTPTPTADATTVLAEPTAGIAAVYQLLASPRSRLNLAVYELADTAAERILAADAARGVTVRVVLDRRREQAANTAAYRYLAGHGVAVRWAPAGFAAYHEKAFTVDGTAAAVMTLNLVAEDYPDTRDFAVIDHNPADVAAIDTVFDADFAGQAVTPPPDARLVWSPGSQAALVDLIDSARKSLAVENEELSDRAVDAALEAAARRHVAVAIVMTDSTQWHAEFTVLAAAGANVRTYPDQPGALYIHAKVIVVDGAAVFVGSENDSVASLDDNRELGVVTADPAVVAPISAVVAGDAAGGAPWPP